MDPAKERNRYTSNISDIQADYQERKRKLIEGKEKELDTLEGHYEKKRDNLKENQEAVINHIQTSQQETMEKAQEQREAIVKRSQKEIRQLDENYKTRSNDLQQNRNEKFENANRTYKEKISEQEMKNERRLEDKKAKANDEYIKLTNKYRDQVSKTQARQENNLNSVRSNNESVIASERNRGQSAEKELREDITKRYERVDQMGSQKIQEKKIQSDSKVKKLEEEGKKQLESKKASLDKQDQRMDSEYSKRRMEKKQANEDLMRSQQRGFDSVYQKNDFGNKISLQIQARNFAKELAQQHHEFLTASSKYAGKEEDPFYKVQDRGSELNENRHFYVLKAYVPEHEKENVNVIIQKDKATISTQRQFNQELEDEDGKKITTNSAQTLREEFQFDSPIISEGVARERSGDYVFVTIPKLQSFRNRNIKG